MLILSDFKGLFSTLIIIIILLLLLIITINLLKQGVVVFCSKV